MPDLMKAVRADARRLVRYVKGAPTVDAERKIAAALLAQRATGFRVAENMLELSTAEQKPATGAE
jgi:hypothetical protein